MKFINYLSTIKGVSIYPMVSLLIFFFFFVFLAIFVFTRDKKEIERQSNLPIN